MRPIVEISTEGLAFMHKNYGEKNNPPGLMMLKQLDGQFAHPGRNAVSTLSRENKKNPQSLSHPSCVNTLIAVGKVNKWVTSHLERFSLQSFVQNHKACVLSLSQFAGLVLRSKLGPRRQAGAYSVGVVATGVRMGVSDSLKGHIGEMALWL